MRILVVSPYLPWPLNAGGNAAQFTTLKCLEQDHQFTLVCPVFDDVGEANAKQLQAQLPQVNVRAIFCGKPKPLTPELLSRAKKLVAGYVRRLTNQPVLQPDIADLLYYPFNPLPKQLIIALQNELSKGVDLCQAEFAEMLPLGVWFPKQLPKLFIHHQIHHVYAKRFIDTHGTNGYLTYLEAVMQTQELAYLQSFQGVITFSEQDRQVLLPQMAAEKLFTSPFPIPADVGIAREIPAKFDGRFLFVASEGHDPNRDALNWLLTKIWPEILRKLPSARLVVIGNWSEPTKIKLTTPEVSFSGFVSDLPAILRGGIMLVPLRIGSGIRVKIMVAMAQGVPVVSTSVGSEGMLAKNGEDLLVRDGEFEFAAAAIELAENSVLWKNLAIAGRVAVSKHYSLEGVRQRRNEIYAVLAQRQ